MKTLPKLIDLVKNDLIEGDTPTLYYEKSGDLKGGTLSKCKGFFFTDNSECYSTYSFPLFFIFKIWDYNKVCWVDPIKTEEQKMKNVGDETNLLEIMLEGLNFTVTKKGSSVCRYNKERLRFETYRINDWEETDISGRHLKGTLFVAGNPEEDNWENVSFGQAMLALEQGKRVRIITNVTVGWQHLTLNADKRLCIDCNLLSVVGSALPLQKYSVLKG